MSFTMPPLGPIQNLNRFEFSRPWKITPIDGMSLFITSFYSDYEITGQGLGIWFVTRKMSSHSIEFGSKD